MRGGSSKGLYFRKEDLPADDALRDRVLVAAMGSDARQIDGAGGAHPLTSKVAIVSRSASSDADIDYLFVQVVVGEGRVDTTPNCGNILAGVAPFAIEHGLVEARDGVTPVRVRMLNSDNLCELLVETPGKRVNYDGDATHRRRAGHVGADRLQLSRRGGLGHGQPVADGPRARRRRRHRGHVHRQRHARRRAARARSRRHGL